MSEARILSAPLVLEFPFTRSLGPVQSAFLTGLRERIVLGVRGVDGRVLCPPVEYDPVTAEELPDLVEVAATGTVTTWAWDPEPAPRPAARPPFAWVLVQLDGADTALLHALDAALARRRAHRHAGPRPLGRRARGRHHRHRLLRAGRGRRADDRHRAARRRCGTSSPSRSIRTPARLDYRFTAGAATSRFLRGIAEKQDPGRALPGLPQGHVPPRGACPTYGVPPPSRSSCPTGAPSPRSASSTSSSKGSASRCRTSAPHRARRRRHRAARPGAGDPVRPGAHGPAGRGRVGRRRRAQPDLATIKCGAHRRARRRLRDATRSMSDAGRRRRRLRPDRPRAPRARSSTRSRCSCRCCTRSRPTPASTSEIDFTCSGSTDYLAGSAFSFVMALDGVGAWPPISESHVEMDGAWALYEAWVKMQTGERRHRARLRLRQVVARRPARRADPPARPVLPGAPVARLRGPRRPPGPGLHRRRGHRTSELAEIAARSRAPPPTTPTPSCRGPTIPPCC